MPPQPAGRSPADVDVSTPTVCSKIRRATESGPRCWRSWIYIYFLPSHCQELSRGYPFFLAFSCYLSMEHFRFYFLLPQQQPGWSFGGGKGKDGVTGGHRIAIEIVFFFLSSFFPFFFFLSFSFLFSVINGAS